MSDRPYATLVRYEPENNGAPDYIAFHPELPGCFAQGYTPQEAIDNLAEVRLLWIKSLLEDGLPVPEPDPLWSEAPTRLYWLEAHEPRQLREFAPA
jgi:predicted RNase H-like HicB family nuclease